MPQAKECRNYESIMDQAIACISAKKGQRSCCSFAEATKAHRAGILKRPNGIGTSTGGGYEKTYSLSTGFDRKPA